MAVVECEESEVADAWCGLRAERHYRHSAPCCCQMGYICPLGRLASLDDAFYSETGKSPKGSLAAANDGDDLGLGRPAQVRSGLWLYRGWVPAALLRGFGDLNQGTDALVVVIVGHRSGEAVFPYAESWAHAAGAEAAKWWCSRTKRYMNICAACTPTRSFSLHGMYTTPCRYVLHRMSCPYFA